MTTETLRIAIGEAKRFLAVAERCEKTAVTASWGETLPDYVLTAGTRRASMDLTRALAAVRRP